MEEMETRNSLASDGRDAEQVNEAQAHHYDASKYERPSVTVDVVMMSLRQRDLQVLLVKRRSWPFEGMWAIRGGFVNIDESLETAAKRELQEETNVQDVYLEQLYTFGDLGRDPRTRVITGRLFCPAGLGAFAGEGRRRCCQRWLVFGLPFARPGL